MAATDAAATLAALREHLAHTQTKLYTASTPGYADLERCFVVHPVRTLGIVARPRTAADAAEVVRFCSQRGVGFSVRSGGHDCAGRTRAEGALVVDMRDVGGVEVDGEEGTARVGGGVLSGEVVRALGERGLATPCGSLSSVGYVGWSTLGGYGALTNRFGLGVDQIVGARVVNAAGEVVDADDDMLEGIRGGGGTLGVIVELTIRVYPLRGGILHSMVVYESGDLGAAMESYADFYEGLAEAGELPTALQIKPLTLELPGLGMVFAVMVDWADPDEEEEGRRWISRIAGAAPCVVEKTEVTSLGELLAAGDRMLTWPFHGRLSTVSIRRWTAATAAVLARNSLTAPGGGLALSVHTMRSAQKKNEEASSVFGARMPHHVVEIIGLVKDEALREERIAWAGRVKEELLAEDPDNVLETSYVSLGSDEDTDLKKVYGAQYGRLMALKEKYDGGNVFRHAIPRLVN